MFCKSTMERNEAFQKTVLTVSFEHLQMQIEDYVNIIYRDLKCENNNPSQNEKLQTYRSHRRESATKETR